MKKTLYLGLDPSRYPHPVVHHPLIEIVERKQLFFDRAANYDYTIFTSRSAVAIFAKHTDYRPRCIVVGKGTEELALEKGFEVAKRAVLEQGEGVLAILENLEGSFFFPHSSKARPLLLDYLKEREAFCFPAYDTVFCKKKIDLTPFDALVFTSPSTVEAFCALYGKLPEDKKLIAIGPITEKALR